VQRRARRLSLFLVAIIVALLSAEHVGAAPARPVTVGPVPPVSVTEKVTVNTLTRTAPIVCQPTMQLPHRSSHDPTNVNWITNITCTAPVASLSATLRLLWVGHTWYGPKTNANAGSPSLTSQIDAPCNTGDYQGVADWTVRFFSGGSGRHMAPRRSSTSIADSGPLPRRPSRAQPGMAPNARRASVAPSEADATTSAHSRQAPWWQKPITRVVRGAPLQSVRVAEP
jgi:hypothetical protein